MLDSHPAFFLPIATTSNKNFWKCRNCKWEMQMFVNSEQGAIKRGCYALSAFPSFIKPGTRQTGLTGRFQKSFDMNSWHLLRKGENRNERENGKRILGLMTDEKRECIFWQRVLRKCTDAKRQRKRRLERLFKSWMPSTFVKGSCFGTPLYTTCKSEQGWR